jgi:hypothetical protein
MTASAAVARIDLDRIGLNMRFFPGHEADFAPAFFVVGIVRGIRGDIKRAARAPDPTLVRSF